MDLLPTFAALAGCPLPHDAPPDGVELSSAWCGGATPPPRDLFWRSGDRYALRRGPWKLLVQAGRPELYHLGDDPTEASDVADREPARVAEMAAAIAAWEAQVAPGGAS